MYSTEQKERESEGARVSLKANRWATIVRGSYRDERWGSAEELALPVIETRHMARVTLSSFRGWLQYTESCPRQKHHELVTRMSRGEHVVPART